MIRKLSPLLLLLLLSTVLFGCSTTPGRIDRNPEEYDGKTVRIRGAVEKIYSIPLTGVSVFFLKDSEAGAPVVSLKEREKGGRIVVKGRVWAFPEDGMNAGSVQAVEAVEDFLVENDLVRREKARDVSALVLTAVRKLASGLGEVWFIIEK